VKQGSLLDLAAGWVEDAKLLREHGASEAAVTTEKHAREVVEAVKIGADEELTLEESVLASGYSKRRLRELIADGTIANAGRKGAPRIKRKDLPKRAKSKKADSFDASAEAQTILSDTGASA